MATLADYYLPAQVGESGCDPYFAVVREEQFDGVRAMVSERRVAVGLSALAAWDWTAAGNRIVSASMVNTLRTSIETAIPYYINTSVHADGDIEGAASVTLWTKATLFAAAGIGDGSNWTNATGSYGSTLASNTVRLALDLNEIVLACQSLTHLKIVGGWTDMMARSGGSGSTKPNCADAKSAAESDYASASWTTTSSRLLSSEASDSTYYADVARVRGKVTADLSSVSAGTAKVYLFATVPLARFEPGHADDIGGTFAADSKYHEFSSPSVGSAYTSATINDYSTPPPWTKACPVSAPLGQGWMITQVVAVAAPTFALTS